jgi:hypothetical protein
MGMKWKGPSGRDFINALVIADREARANAKAVAKEEAEIVKKIGEAQAPLDTGELEKAFTLTMNRLRSDRTLFNIEVGGIVNGVDVDEYALKMHESAYKLGHLSEVKQARVGRVVGPKYLERAFDERVEIMTRRVNDALFQGMNRYVG